jgi:hypothetical protein
MTRRLILFVVGLLLAFNSNGQNLLNTESTLKQNQIKAINVYNCIDSGGCIMDHYEFNKNGQITMFKPAIVNPYWSWDYYPNGKVRFALFKYKCCGDDTILNSKQYFYKSNGKLRYIIYIDYENGKPIKIDTLRSGLNSPVDDKRKTVKNSLNQIIEQELGEIYYPCGIVFEGKNFIKYSYDKNGLITFGKIYNENDELIVDLKYVYQKY